jgi:glycosyltransferase involved in cell wall biosynthesis
VLPEDGPLAADLRAAGIEVLVRPLAVLRRSVMSPSGIRRVAAAWAADAGGLGRLARSRGVALVHTNTSTTLGGAAVARVAGVPHVWHVREIYAGYDLWWPAYRRLLVTAHAMPCVSRATCAQFEGAPAAFTLHDALTHEPRGTDPAAARRALGLPPDAVVVALVARVSGWKGQDLLVRALAEPALAARPQVVALLAGAPRPGEERHRRELHELAGQLAVAGRVHDVGFRDDLDAVYAAADLVATASTHPDPLPNPLLEAAVARRPVVAAAHGGAPEVVRDGVTGLLVPPRDAGALAEAIARLADDAALRAGLAAAAEADIRHRFGRPRLLADLQRRYDALLDRR